VPQLARVGLEKNNQKTLLTRAASLFPSPLSLVAMQLSYYLLANLCSWYMYASAKSVFNGVEQDNEFPRLLNTEDPRIDGISYEINKALVAEHLKATSHTCTFEGLHGNVLEDLMKPGARHISLSYWDHWTCSRTDNFLRILNDTEADKESKWIIDARGMWAFQGNMTLLADVIRTLPAIVEIHWNTQRLIPAIILETLQQSHPDCRLYYTIPLTTFDGNQTPEILPFNTDGSRTEQNILETRQVIQDTTPQSILESKNLYSLKAHIDHNLLLPSEKLDLIHQILLTCPNIRELELKIDIAKCASSDQSKCCEDPSRNAILAFDFTRHDGTLPPLEVLKLEGYRFDFAVDGTHVDPEVNMPLEMANLKAWLKHMDWSHLRSLHLSNPLTQSLKLFADTLPNLQHFRIDGGDLNYVRAPVVKYLAKIPSLESLAIEEAELRPLDTLLDVIQNYHSTLRSFKLNHQRDGPRARTSDSGDRFWANTFQYAPATFLNSTQLGRLFEICPDLQSLDLDIQTNSVWNYGILDKLLSFPQLRELTLRFPPETAAQFYGGFPHLQRQVDQPELNIVMKGLRNYLKKGKVGEPFKVLKTFLGWKEFGDREEAERGPEWMI